MDSSLINGFITAGVALAGVVATTFVSVYSIRHNDITQRQKRKVSEILDNLIGFHELEEVYIEKLAEARKKNGDTTFVTHDAIVKETRKALREKNIDFDFSPYDVNIYSKAFNISKN